MATKTGESNNAYAKLEIYERIASVSDSKVQLGFGPPISREGGN